MKTNKEIFVENLQSVIEKKEIIKLTLSGKRNMTSDTKKIIITLIELKKGFHLNFVFRHNTKDITKNYEITQGIEIIEKTLDEEFLNADLFSKNDNVSLFTLPNGKIRLKTNQPTLIAPVSISHDKAKERLIHLHKNIYLRELGITNGNWEVRREMSDKYKQINQYIELLAPYLNDITLPENYHVVDMGSGKGYLTFALFDYLSNKLQHTLQMTGVEFREELVDICNTIAQNAGYEKLHFVKGTIEKTELDKIDILIALHACDTATDEAIFRGITSNAELIVCAPCCHKQIRKAMNINNELSNITKYGILKERQAEIITDTIRAMILEVHGYKTNVFEFISLEHTPKNVMIVGKKNKIKTTHKNQILNDIAAMKKLFGIEQHYLEKLLSM